MKRRALLTTAAALTGGVLSGCTGSREWTYFYTLYNYSDAEHEVSIRVEREDSTSLVDRTVVAAPRAAREHVTFDGAPARIRVGVNGENRTDGFDEWPGPSVCDRRGIDGLPGFVIRVLPEADDRRSYIDWQCESVRPEG